MKLVHGFYSPAKSHCTSKCVNAYNCNKQTHTRCTHFIQWLGVYTRPCMNWQSPQRRYISTLRQSRRADGGSEAVMQIQWPWMLTVSAAVAKECYRNYGVIQKGHNPLCAFGKRANLSAKLTAARMPADKKAACITVPPTMLWVKATDCDYIHMLVCVCVQKHIHIHNYIKALAKRWPLAMSVLYTKHRRATNYWLLKSLANRNKAPNDTKQRVTALVYAFRS